MSWAALSVQPMPSLNASQSLAMSEDNRKQCVTQLLEELERFVDDDNCDHKSCNQLIQSVCHCIKSEANRLEADESFAQQMDVYFNLLRNVLRNSQLKPISRALLLEVIELRAANWTDVDHIDKYYSKKLPELRANDLMDTKSISSFDSNESSKCSVKASKVAAKVSLKQEVVIRNGDSGKVMGIKGRRVHMIEEMSQTVISFQRVPPGAKERMVQIIGPTEENIERAKRLIEDTIRRNTSPVPFDSHDKPINDLNLNEKTVVNNEKMAINAKSDAIIDDQMGFTFTVTVDNEVIKLSTNSYRVGIKAKQLLEEKFAIKYDSESQTCCGDEPKEVNDTTTDPQLYDKELMRQQRLKLEAINWETIEPISELKDTPSVATVPIGRTSLRFMSNQKSKSKDEKITYDRQFLLNCAELPLSNVLSGEEVMKLKVKIPEIFRNITNH